MADDSEEKANTLVNESYSDDAGPNDGDLFSEGGPVVQESEQLPRLEFKSASEDPLTAVPDTHSEGYIEAQLKSYVTASLEASPGKLVRECINPDVKVGFIPKFFNSNPKYLSKSSSMADVSATVM